MPGSIVVDESNVAGVRAEDESGEFGVLPHHADFVTALATSVIGWRRADGAQGYCAVRGGLMTVTGGRAVAIATREAIVGDDLSALEAVVSGHLKVEAEAQRQARARAEQLRIQAIRQIVGVLRPEGPNAGRDRL